MICSLTYLDTAEVLDKANLYKLGLYKLQTKSKMDIIVIYWGKAANQNKLEDCCTELKSIQAGVPQGCVLGLVLYLLYTANLPQIESIATFMSAELQQSLTVGSNVEEATRNYRKPSIK